MLVAQMACAPRHSPAVSIVHLWDASSRLTPTEASEVLVREANGEAVGESELFEAEKYLRTDGGVLLGAYVVTETLTRLLRQRLHGGAGDVRVRTFPPVLQWLESRRTSDSVTLRGECLQLAVLNRGPDVAVTVLRHQTIFQDWRLCGATPCFTPVTDPLRPRVAYVLALPNSGVSADEARFSDVVLSSDLTGWLHSAANGRKRSSLAGVCDPEPSVIALSDGSAPALSLRHEAANTVAGEANQVLCGLRATGREAVARLTYLIADAPAAPPARAARSSSRNNPLEFALFESSDRR